MAGTTAQLGELQTPVTSGGVEVSPGDLILAEEEGVIVVDPDRIDVVLDADAAVKDSEAELVCSSRRRHSAMASISPSTG
ncbi:MULTISPECIES: hypothetical protein [unclassified Nocardia]|uniref:RraA family protein n=1 Tax=unclassified Nocardia TaxID=2637762 RepID=UPI0034312DC0